ncbi:hypothetical protein NP233_g963 [Leucocoprinus birnbaumii]|uniref:TECPR1-like DysF domain-containing protein n=1 Tax=Leucocoprinus birnbaumii TaxID=56174 RepID=A0AAD5W3D7_9AGAR|nr:hypothetical protein NP233_g963 [Leucocoprinus birnbaumii]
MTLASQASPPHPSEHTPPPPSLVQDDSTTTEGVRQRFAPKSRLARVLSLPKLNLRNKAPSKQTLNINPRRSEAAAEANNVQNAETSIDVSASDDAPITLSDTGLKGEDDVTVDSMTLFSIPYYSALSLLPTDPSAFTLPNASHKRSEQPSITLDTYPLPDGNWHWVSRTWMIDMRNSDSGVVQHDGFEYNWVFRRHNWRAQVGFLSAGGWVRRRRWIRLMVRPAKNKPLTDLEGSMSPSSVSSKGNLLRHSLASSNISSISDLHHATVESVWCGNEDDWKRCRTLMIRYVRDGRKIDLWRIWLGFYHPSYQDQFADLVDQGHGKGKGKQKQWTEDDGPLPSQLLASDAASHRSMTPPPREYFVPVLQKHGRDLLQMFVYPDSRAQFLKLLGRAGLLADLSVSIGPDFSTSELEFWSYTNGLDEELRRLQITNSCTPTTNSTPHLQPATLRSHSGANGQ